MRRLLLLCAIALHLVASVSPVLVAVRSEPDPARRSEKALEAGENEFDNARASFTKGDLQAGNDHLTTMTEALEELVSSLAATHKSKGYKRAEMRVGLLQRRMKGLLDDIGIEDRGWADQTDRRIAEIRDKLIAGALRK